MSLDEFNENVCKGVIPLSEFEQNVPKEWWKTLFNSLYLKTDGDVVEDPEITTTEVDAFVDLLQLEQNERILDLCCGQGRHSMELATRGFRHVQGLDQSAFLIDVARKRASEKRLPVNFTVGDAREIPFDDGQFDVVMCLGNSFGYSANTETDSEILAQIRRLLVPGGRLFLDLTDGSYVRDNYNPRSWEWVDSSLFVCRERTLSKDRNTLISREVITDPTHGVIADQFYSEKLFDSVTITQLLESAGFVRVIVHGNMKADSKRGQDLGMMEQRLLVTCYTPNEAEPSQDPHEDLKVESTSATAPTVEKRRVTVVFGDPRLPDACKRDGQWNPEDFDTVNKAKEALLSFDDLQITFIDEHSDNLPDLIRKSCPDVVLNLCDEGLYNDAYLELHIPAVCEFLRLPYSGSGPRCLAICYDKALVRGAALQLGVPCPQELFVHRNLTQSPQRLLTLLEQNVKYPALVKPSCGDGSVGITVDSVVTSAGAALQRLLDMHQSLPGRDFLVQEFCAGTEYTVALLGNGAELRALPLLEVDYSQLDASLPKILGYESKWLLESPYVTQVAYKPASLSPSLQQQMIEASKQMFERCGCSDYARFDWRCDAEGTPKLLEVNPNPGWCWDGKFALMCELAGMEYRDCLRGILDAAWSRIQAPRN